MDVVNVFALITPDPKQLVRHDDPVGADNLHHIGQAVADSSSTVVGWGSSWKREHQEHVDMVLDVIRGAEDEIHHLGLTPATQQPRHPSRAPLKAQRLRWS